MFFQTIAMVMGWRIGDISPGGAFDLDAAAASFVLQGCQRNANSVKRRCSKFVTTSASYSS